MVRIAFRFLCVAVAVVGCGSDVTATQACANLARDRCTELSTCSATDLQRRWPDLATCEAREQLACQEALAAPKTANTPAHEDSCGPALASQACDAFLSGVSPPAACLLPHGPGAAGAAC